MDIKAEIEKLRIEKKDKEAIIEVYKERIKEINLQCRKLQTLQKHAEEIMSSEEKQAVKDHEEAEA